MAFTQGYKEYVLEQLGVVGDITSRNMFGGVGIYSDGLFFALISNDELFFKVDASNLADFESAGSSKFEPYGDGRTMNYYTVPAAILEDIDRLKLWAEKAVNVARTAKASKK